jgi:hypothetical protein
MTSLDNAKVKALCHKVRNGPCFNILVDSYIGSVLVVAAFAGGYLSLLGSIIALTLFMIVLQLYSVSQKLKTTEVLLKQAIQKHTEHVVHVPEAKPHGKG